MLALGEPAAGVAGEMTPLAGAAAGESVKHTECVRLLLAAGALPDGGLRPRRMVRQSRLEVLPPLFVAARSSAASLKLLLDAGADPHVIEKRAGNALTYALQHWKADSAALLLDRGVCVNVTGALGRTPLYCACQMGHTDLVARLLALGARVNIRVQDGRTPLHAAVYRLHAPCATLLLTAAARSGRSVSRRTLDSAMLDVLDGGTG